MNNICIKKNCGRENLDRSVILNDGSIIVQKENDQIIGIYLVVPFRDQTAKYCTLINLDNGETEFSERCSRITTERRILRHITHAGYTYPYVPDSHDQDDSFKNMRIQVYEVGNYKMEISLQKELMLDAMIERETNSASFQNR